MTRMKMLRPSLCVGISLLAWLSVASCASKSGGHNDRVEHTIWFVHATDPHLFLFLMEPNDPAKKATWEDQQKQDEAIFKTFLQNVSTLPGTSGAPAFLLISGDFGADPCLIPSDETLKKPQSDRTVADCIKVNEKGRSDQIEELANLFAASPIRDIHFVAGNNDLPLETASEDGLSYFNKFFQDVQAKLSVKNANIHLHNMTGCYGPNGGAISECAYDIAGTPYRMIGFPSYSFKNRETKKSYDDNKAQQTAQLSTFRGLFERAANDGKKVIIVTHIPEMDDPYFQAQRRYAKVAPPESENQDKDKDNPRSLDSTWNVEKSVLDGWTKVVSSDSVTAVLAGHLHDSHKEVYQRPYSWSTLKDYQLGYRKLFLAPPLSVKSQDNSPIQARGFSVVSLDSDHVNSRFYWYNGITASFALDSSPEHHGGEEEPRFFLGRTVAKWFAWIWHLGDVVLPLEHTATMLIALLTAFLTVVALWQIAPSDDPLAKKPTGNDSTPAPPVASSSPFTTRFGTTVLAGLGGLVFAEVTKTLGNQTPSADTKWYYIDCFIFFFFALLLGLNILRAAAEALRSRVAIIHYPLARPPRPGRDRAAGFWWNLELFFLKFWDWLFYWVLRILHWVFSLRVPLLTFFDTFINLIQGKNQTSTQAFTDALIDQQRNVVRVADVIRKNLNTAFHAALGQDHRVRVSISVLSADQTNVFYISRSASSPQLPFPKNSVAWVSIFTGKIRWYESFYKGNDIVLLDNSGGVVAGAPTQLKLADYYEDRHDDYRAFVLLPVPRPQRGFGSKYIKGAIHISFGTFEDFGAIWTDPAVHLVPLPPVAAGAPAPIAGPVPPAAPPASILYPDQDQMLGSWCARPEVRAALNAAVLVLGELLHGFNELIYKNYIQPGQGD